MGRAYRLAVEWSAEPFVRVDGARLIVGAREPTDVAHCRRVLTAFYVLEARSLFPLRLSAVLAPFERKGLKRPHLIIRRMTKRWGSYTPRTGRSEPDRLCDLPRTRSRLLRRSQRGMAKPSFQRDAGLGGAKATA